MATEIVPFGTTISINGTVVDLLTELKPPGIEMDTVETTHHGQGDTMRRFRGTMSRLTSSPLKVQANSDQFDTLMALPKSDIGLVPIVITIPDNGGSIVLSFSANVKNVTPDNLVVDGIWMMDIELEGSAGLTIT